MEIEKNIPIKSALGKQATGRSKYPFEEMGVNDSFTVPISDFSGNASALTSMLVSAKNWAKKNNLQWEFTTRTEKDKVRIWRVA